LDDLAPEKAKRGWRFEGKPKPTKMKEAERLRQKERPNREGHRVQARPVKTFRKIGDKPKKGYR